MTQWLRGYQWDTGIHRYRNATTGRIVARNKILGLLDRSIEQRESRIVNGVTPYVEGRCTRNEWISRTQTLIKREYLQSTALAKGGWDRLTPSDYGRIGPRLRIEYLRIQGTAQDIADGKCSLAQATQRMHQALGRTRGLAMDIERANQPPTKDGTVRLERRITAGEKNVCDDCERYYKMGWQLAGVLPSPGEASACSGNCRCTIETEVVPSDEVASWIGRAEPGGPLLKGEE